MDKIKRLVLGLIPNSKCNLKCEYCYISQLDGWQDSDSMQYSPQHIRKCLSKERLGGVSLINLTGNGETMLQPEIVPLAFELLHEGHYVEIVTNGTVTKNIEKIMAFPPDLLERLEFKISFHYKELKRLNIMQKFFDNVDLIRRGGASFSLELMAYDGIENEIDEIREVCLSHVGAVCHATIGRDDSKKSMELLSKHSEEEFRTIWASLDSEMFGFKLDMLGVKRREYCYAGDWSLFVNMHTGESRPCYWQPYNQNIFKNPDKPIKFEAVGHYCLTPYCVNSHAHMCWGIIPSVETPTYNQMRNRETQNGDSWITGKCDSFFQSKLEESNPTHSPLKRFANTVTYPFRSLSWIIRYSGRSVRMIKNHIKKRS